MVEPQKQKPPPRRRLSEFSALFGGRFGLCRFGLCCFGLGCVGFGVFAAEALHTSRSVHEFLLAGKEWMAIGADFHVDIAFVRGTGGELVAASAMHANFVVCRMNTWLHDL